MSLLLLSNLYKWERFQFGNMLVSLVFCARVEQCICVVKASPPNFYKERTKCSLLAHGSFPTTSSRTCVALRIPLWNLWRGWLQRFLLTRKNYLLPNIKFYYKNIFLFLFKYYVQIYLIQWIYLWILNRKLIARMNTLSGLSKQQILL